MAIYKSRRIGGRRMRKPMRKPRIMRRKYRYTGKKSYKKIVEIKRVVSLAGVNQTSAIQHLSYQFKLSDLPNYTELTNLYDQYKIKSVQLKFVPTVTGSDMNPQATSVALPSIHSVLDFSDATALTSLNDYLQYSTYKQTAPLKTHKRFIYPKQLQYAQDQSTGLSALADVKNIWVRSESPNINHLGCKVMIPAASTSFAFQFEVYATYYVLCKQTK